MGWGTQKIQIKEKKKEKTKLILTYVWLNYTTKRCIAKIKQIAYKCKGETLYRIGLVTIFNLLIS
jgi:hypothetical protein